tara:strand:+ start:275 stop:814 length:540 start_codon:yes stop_codon:yes gene_type:complete
MKSTSLKNAKLIGEFYLNGKESVKKNLNFRRCKTLSNTDWKKEYARVYFILVDDEVRKIGGSNAKGGICGTISPYCAGNCGRPSDRTFGVNYLIEEALRNGSKVELYAQWLPPQKVTVPTINKKVKINVDFSYKTMEERCIIDYKKKQKQVPAWNFQEDHREWPKHIREARQILLGGKL